MSVFDSLVGLFPVVAGLALLGLAAFVLRAMRDRIHNVFFASLYTFSGLKSIGEGVLPRANGFHDAAPLFPAAGFWAHVSIVCAFFMLPLLVLFLLHFPRPVRFLRQRPWWIGAFFVPTALFLYGFYGQPAGVDRLRLALALNALALVATAAAFLYLVRTHRTTPDPVERKRAAYVLLGFGPAFLGTWVIAILEFVQYYRQAEIPGLATALLHFVTPLLELAAAFLTAYAIVKYQLLGIEFKFKTGLRYTLTTFVIGFVLITLNEFLGEFVFERVFGFTQFYWLLAGIVGVVLFKPVEKAVGRLTDWLFPGVRTGQAEYDDGRAREIYHAQVTYVMRDAQVTERERRFLDHLRGQLQLSLDEAGRIEAAVARLLHPEAGAGAASPPRPSTGG